MKLTIIGRNGKIWRLSIVEEDPKVVKKVKMVVCRDESDGHRNKRKPEQVKHRNKRNHKSHEDI
jgi:hypothetical protein